MTAYIYGELVDYLDDIVIEENKEEMEVLLMHANAALSKNFEAHIGSENALREILSSRGITVQTSSYQRGYLNIRQVAETITEMLA